MKVEQFDKATHAKRIFESNTNKTEAAAFLLTTLRENPGTPCHG